MRTFSFLVFSVAALAAVLWMSRPAALGDAGGLYALLDTAAPAAAGWRANYLRFADPAAATAGPAAVAKADPAAKTAGKPKAPPVLVMTKPAELRTLDLTFEGLGTVQAIASLVIKPRADSQIVEVAVAEGAAVKAGDLLFKLDDTALKAQLAQADAQIAKDRAQLDQNKRDLARNQDLLKQKFVAPQVVEMAQTTLNQTTAQIAVDEALRNGIVTSLSYMRIRASVSGRIGSIAAKAGATVKAGDTLATVNQIDPIYIAFAVPQNRLGDLRAAMAAGKAKVRLRDDPAAPAGSIAFIENAVDTTTGTVSIKASMPNRDEKLWPGAFANVVVVTGTEDNVLVVPSDAVQVGQKGSYVFVAIVGHASLKLVKVERVAGDLTVIASGLSAGDQVVVQGQMALTDGAELAPAKPAEAQDSKTKSGSTESRTASQG